MAIIQWLVNQTIAAKFDRIIRSIGLSPMVNHPIISGEMEPTPLTVVDDPMMVAGA